MKIGIVSNYEWLRQWDNYGTLLQNFALQETLKRLGHGSFWILTSGVDSRDSSERIRNFCSQLRYQPVEVARSLASVVVASRKADDGEKLIRRFNEQNPRSFSDFFARHIATSKCEYDIKMLRERPPDCDAYIVGSDNIWADVSPVSFLDFGLSDVRRIAFSVSAPWGRLSRYWHARASKEILKFDAISVREADGVEVCKRLSREDAVHTLDPTLLLVADDYRRLYCNGSSRSVFEKKAVLGYLINVEVLSQIPWECLKAFAEVSSLDLKVVPLQGTELIIPYENVITPSPIEWLQAFDHAECVVTNSFHGTVFAIIFNKPFVVIPTGIEGTGGGDVRFRSLLESLGLEDRIFSGSTPHELGVLFSKRIDWVGVNQRLDVKRKESIDFLLSSLGVV